MIRRALLALGALVLAGCTAGPDGSLTADLVTPVDIRLQWTGTEHPAAQVVEFATAPDGPWTVVEFLPPERRSFQHADLIPQTPFYHRIRPVEGPATPPAPVRLAPAFDVRPPEDLNWAAPRVVPGSPDAAGGGAPTGLRVTPRTRDAVLVTWTDNTSDEEGFLIEVQPAGAADWTVAMVVDPDITSVGVVAPPGDSQLRVRAYRYGTPSNTTHRTTGGRP
jgi:hypothetical protein